jgi:hypothetical protein
MQAREPLATDGPIMIATAKIGIMRIVIVKATSTFIRWRRIAVNIAKLPELLHRLDYGFELRGQISSDFVALRMMNRTAPHFIPRGFY